MSKSRHYAVIGGTSGMGFALARLLVERGDEVRIGGRDEERLADAVRRLGPRATGRIVNSRDRDSLRAFFEGTPKLSGLFLPGASYRPVSFAAGTRDEAEDIFNAKFWGQYWAAHSALPHLLATAAIVLMSGSASVRPSGSPVYAACNAAIEGLGRALARELAPIRVNTLSPGMVMSELWRDRPAAMRDPMLASWSEKALVGRPGSVEEAASAAAFLLDNGNMTAATIHFDGGWTMR